MPLKGLFVTGTDTGVGKTHVAAGVIGALRDRGVRVGAYKPAVTGCRASAAGPVWDDLVRLHEALGGEYPLDSICPQRFEAPLAPPVAAQREGRTVNSRLLRSGAYWWRERVDFLVVEGVGGLLAPMSESELVADVACDLGFPLLLVARRSLGTINHTLLTLEAASKRGLAVAGIVLNQPLPTEVADLSVDSNAAELARRCAAPIIAILPHETTAALRHPSPLSKIDWVQLMSAGSDAR